MSRRRWIYRETEPGKVEAIEATADTEPAPRVELILDGYYDGVRATDGTDIGSRAKRTAYMKSRGLADAADFTETWKKAAVERDAVYLGNHDSKARREDIGRALYNLKKKAGR